MLKVLVVGNVIKDVYLSLDERQNRFEEGEGGVAYMDLAFDGSSHKFFRRSAVLSGAAVSMEVVRKMGLSAELMGGKVDFTDGGAVEGTECEYRYILCRGEEICYLTGDERREAEWTTPGDTVDWIYIDRSVTVTENLIQKLQSYATLSKGTRLAYYVGKEAGETERKLAKMANIVFSEEEIETNGIWCQITDGEVAMGPLKMEWRAERADLRTHLTMRLTLAATVLAALLSGKSARDALLMAKLNVENASLNATLSFEKLEKMIAEVRASEKDLEMTAASLVAKGKGILAADESGGSIHKKFEAAGIPDDAEHRRDYRNILVTAPNLPKYVSGVILFDETARQHADDGRTFTEYLTSVGVIPGIKVDQGLVEEDGETWTRGLEGLPERLEEYHEMGLRFAKWRAAFAVEMDGEKVAHPSAENMVKNAEILARYAKLCQNAGIVPIVEPEVVHDGDYSIETCAGITGEILDKLFEKLREFDVSLPACILKCNMVLAGKKFEKQSTPAEVGKATAEVLKEHVPKELAGVVFLSGGQTPEQVTNNLAEVIKNGPFEWPVTFSFARALQDPALEKWHGDNQNKEAAGRALTERLVANTEALKSSE